ncbi:hypothetical protein [Micromonospora sp. NPDC004704]
MNTIVASRYVGQRTADGDPAGPPARRVRRRITSRLALPLLVGALTVAGAGCSAKDRAPAPSAGGASTSPGASPTAPAGEAGVGASPSASAAAQPGNSPGKPAPGTSTGATKPGAATSPVQIVEFRIQQKPTCPQGASEFPVEATPLVIEWKVTGADREVELAVDGPGLYDTYPAQGKESFTFSCGGEPGSVEKHTYKLTAKHGKYVETRTLTATATVYDIATV